MYRQVGSTNVPVAATLPRNSTEIIGQQTHNYTNMSTKPSSHSRIAVSAIDKDMDFKQETRPTYGAYTMPRGPYLQYKYNDGQTTAAMRVNTATANRAANSNINHTIKINNNNINNQNNYYNDNNHQQKRQIEKLKNEFIYLPRARICSTGTSSGEGSGCAGNGGDTDLSDGYMPEWDKNHGLVQTLGRYKQHGRNNEIEGISNTEYFLNGQTMQSNGELNAYENFNYYAMAQNRLNANRNAKYVANARSNDIAFSSLDKQQQQPHHDIGDATDYKQMDSNGNDFLQHLQTKNLHLLSNSSNTNSRAAVDIGAPIHNSQRPASLANSDTITNAPINYVTLAEVVKMKTNGLDHSEGWALLCQSVQALQDLFLSGEVFIYFCLLCSY